MEQQTKKQQEGFFLFLRYNSIGWSIFYLEELFRNIYIEPARFENNIHNSIMAKF